MTHTSLGTQYENHLWNSGSPGSDSDVPWGGGVIVGGCDREVWPSIHSGNADLASECVDGDSASSSEKNLRATVAKGDGGDGKQAHGPVSHFTVANGSDYAGNGGQGGTWGVTHSPAVGVCEGPVEALASGGALNANASHGSWSISQSSGLIGATQADPSVWGDALQEDCSEPAATGGQIQNLNTEKSGPNNTTNGVTSSLPNSTGSLEMDEPSTWHTGAGVDSAQFRTSSIVPRNSKGGNGGSHGVVWAAQTGTTYSSDKPFVLENPAVSDTVNASLAHPAAHGAASFGNCDNDSGSRAQNGAWDSGPKATQTIQTMTWNTGGNVGPASAPRPWESTSSSSSSSSSSSNAGARVSNGEWTSMPGGRQRHHTDSADKKGTGGWKSLEDDALGAVGQQGHGTWSRPAGGSEGSADSSTGSRGDREKDDRGNGRKKANHTSGLVQNMMSRADIDPRVLSNNGWGQTPVRQNTTWDTTITAEKKPDAGTGGWGSAPTPSSSSSTATTGWEDLKSASGWGGAKGLSGQDSWEDSSARNGQSSGLNKEDKSWSGTQKMKQGWSAGPEGWGGESSQMNHWVEPQKSGSGSWDSDSDRSGSGWSETGHRSNRSGSAPFKNDGPTGWGEPSKQGEQNRGWGDPTKQNNQNQSWGDPTKQGEQSRVWDEPAKQNNRGWGEPSKQGDPNRGWGEPPKQNDQNQGWGEPPKQTEQGWGESGSTGAIRRKSIENSKRNQSSSGWGGDSTTHGSPDWNKMQEPASGPSGAPDNNKPSGWLGGPIPAPPKGDGPTGWEEPSPESIRRKMAIDDGTSAWGDPSKYNSSSVNLWGSGAGSETGTPTTPQQAQAPPSSFPGKDKSFSSGEAPSRGLCSVALVI